MSDASAFRSLALQLFPQYRSYALSVICREGDSAPYSVQRFHAVVFSLGWLKRHHVDMYVAFVAGMLAGAWRFAPAHEYGAYLQHYDMLIGTQLTTDGGAPYHGF